MKNLFQHIQAMSVHPFFQSELDSVRDLGLPKDAAKLLSCNENENLYLRITLF